MKIILLILTIIINLTNGQYYQASSNDEIEQKYVNSGQSLTLICDLPNNMPEGRVLFIKYDSRELNSGVEIRGDEDDDRFEIGQQYAWEWSLKINSINEDDSGIYECKAANTIIKQYEIIVRVPPRIKDDNSLSQKSVREGGRAQFSCFANGTPKPNITWFIISNEDQTLIPLAQTGNYLNLDNLNRLSSRRYQCRASNNIPPSDTKNFTLSIEFAPEIEIQSKPDHERDSMTLNCTINAFPLTNRYFWRKDGQFIKESAKHEIKNTRLNEHTLISQLNIRYYNEDDQGLYECTAENDLRVAKIVYSLKDPQESLSKQNLVPIGFANNYRNKQQQQLQASHQNLLYQDDLNIIDSSSTTTKTSKNRKPSINRQRPGFLNHKKTNKTTDLEQESLNEQLFINKQQQQRKHQRNNHKNNSNKANNNLVQKLSTSTNNYNSPYIILINDESSSRDANDESGESLKKPAVLNKNSESDRLAENNSVSVNNFKKLRILMFLYMVVSWLVLL